MSFEERSSLPSLCSTPLEACQGKAQGASDAEPVWHLRFLPAQLVPCVCLGACVHPWARDQDGGPGRGTRTGDQDGDIGDTWLWLQCCSSGESASEGHTEVSTAPVPAPHCLCGPVLWNCTLLLLKWFCSQGVREEHRGCSCNIAASEHPIRNWLIPVSFEGRLGAHPGPEGCPC